MADRAHDDHGISGSQEALTVLAPHRAVPKTGPAAVVSALWLLVVSGCGDNQQPEQAAELLERIGTEYRGWARAPGYPGRERSSAPHGDSVEIFVNETVEEALAAAQPLEAWPEGAIIAKDGYEDGERTYLAVMEKRDGTWFWVERIDGDVKYSGAPDLCTDCHASGDDDVRAFDLP